MNGHVGRMDEVRFAGEVGSDLREQVGWKAVKRGLQGIDMTPQCCKSYAYIFLQSLDLKAGVRTMGKRRVSE